MQTLIIFFLSLILATVLISLTTATKPPQDLIRSSCAQARYPTLCVQTLSNQVGPTTKPLELAQAAVKASLTQTLTLSLYLKKTLKLQLAAVGSTTKNKNHIVAFKDCVVQISDSVGELNRTLNELRSLKMGTLEWQMSNAMTWTSTAITNGNTCVNGVNRSGCEKKMKLEVKKKVMDVSMVTSNALYLINLFGESMIPKRHINSKNP